MAMKPDLELFHRDMRRVTVVKFFERKAELGPKLLQRHLGQSSLAENKVRGAKHRRQIVHQSARPIEDDVANHSLSGLGHLNNVGRRSFGYLLRPRPLLSVTSQMKS